MGVYLLNLTTKSRKVPTPNGDTIEVFTFKFSRKSTYNRAPSWAIAQRARLENVWASRETPNFVCWSENFESDTAVFAPDRLVLNITDDALADLPFAGYLRGTGRSRRFEPWHSATFRISDPVDRLMIKGLLRGPHTLHEETRFRGGDPQRSVTVRARDADDLVLAKLALVA